MTRCESLAKQYAEKEGMHIEKKFGRKLTKEEKELIIMAFVSGYNKAIFLAECQANYSEKGISERIKELKR